MFTLALTASPSRSVTVSDRLIRLSVTIDTGSSGFDVLGWVSARAWSSVTSPFASTLTVNAIAPAGSAEPPEPTRPTTEPPDWYR